MCAMVSLGFEPRLGWEIPRPARPRLDDVSPSAYIPKGMTAEDRRALREAGLEWTDTLGMAKDGVLGWAAGSRFKRAGQNISHYRDGEGAAVELSEGEVEDLQSQTTLFSSVEREFVQLLGDDMRDRAVGTQRHYVAINADPSSPNAHTAWFGAYAKGGTGWYYAMGGFMISYGAMTIRKPGFVAIWYRSFVYDRYNWDLGKDTKLPQIGLNQLLDDPTMEEIAGLYGPDELRYFRSAVTGQDSDGNPTYENRDSENREGEVDGYRLGDRYVVSDALLGALEESGDAQRYDINGSGRVVYVSVPI